MITQWLRGQPGIIAVAVATPADVGRGDKREQQWQHIWTLGELIQNPSSVDSGMRCVAAEMRTRVARRFHVMVGQVVHSPSYHAFVTVFFGQ